LPTPIVPVLAAFSMTYRRYGGLALAQNRKRLSVPSKALALRSRCEHAA
jgi:hypothetical protein